MRAILYVRPKCSYRRVRRPEDPILAGGQGRTICGDFLSILPRKTRCFRDPGRSVLLPSQCFATTVTDSYDCSILTMTGSSTKFSKGLLQSEVWGEVSTLDAGQVGAKLLAKFLAKFSGLVLLGPSEQRKFSAIISAQHVHCSAQQSWRKFGEKLHDKVLQGDPRPQKICTAFLKTVEAMPDNIMLRGK